MESAETISERQRAAISSARAVFPTAVGPTIARTAAPAAGDVCGSGGHTLSVAVDLEALEGARFAAADTRLTHGDVDL